MYDDLPALLPGDVQYYDTQGVYDRLPRDAAPTRRADDREGLTTWLALAAAALARRLVLALQRSGGSAVVVFGATRRPDASSSSTPTGAAIRWRCNATVSARSAGSRCSS